MTRLTTAILAALILPASLVASEQPPTPMAVIQEYCVTCHNDYTLTGGMSLQSFDVGHPDRNAELAERMIRKLRAGLMPPKEMPRPDDDAVLALVEALEHGIDRAADARREPGTRPSQRLNRAEYARLIYDLLDLTIDPAEWLPEDQVSASFDNIADVQTMSPTLMVAYLTAASEVARRALGQEDAPVLAKTYQNPETTDGEANLLDQSMILWGSPMGDANLHNHRRCPLVVIGGANGQLEGGAHIKAAEGTPMANVMLSLLNKLGHEMESFGDSTGELSL